MTWSGKDWQARTSKRDDGSYSWRVEWYEPFSMRHGTAVSRDMARVRVQEALDAGRS